MASFDELVTQRDDLNGQIKALARDELQTVVYEIFAENPGLENFGWWNASADRYNDGTEPGLGSMNVNINLEEPYVSLDYYYVGSWMKDKDEIARVKGRIKLRNTVLAKMQKFDERLLRDILSDGEIVVITPDKVLTFDCDE